MRIAWTTVGDIIQRVVDRHGRGDALDGLTLIGVDELSYRRHHEYVTVVVDHVRGEVVWAHRGKNADTLKAFFDELGAERAAKLEAVTIDMSAAYIKAVTEASPRRADHLRPLPRAAARARRARPGPPRRGARRRHGRRQARAQGHALAAAQEPVEPLHRSSTRSSRSCSGPTGASSAPTCSRRRSRRASTAARFTSPPPSSASGWPGRRAAELAPFVKLARTVKKHLDGILAYVRSRLSNGSTEGINGKIRTITRRSFGFHSADALIAMIQLCCAGIDLAPVFVYPIPPTKPL